MPLRLGRPAMRATRVAAAGCAGRAEAAGVWPETGEKSIAAASAAAATIAPLNRARICRVPFSMLPPVLFPGIVLGPHIVRRVLVDADELNQLRIDKQTVVDLRGERLRVGFRIVDRHLDLE